MKNTLKLLGLVALIAIIGFSVMSCGSKGGTLTITNEFTGDEYILAFAGSQSSITEAMGKFGTNPNDYKIDAGKSKAFTFDEDSTVYYYWISSSSKVIDGGTFKTISVSGGDDVVVKANADTAQK